MTQEYLKGLLSYNEETGIFIWRVHRGTTRCKDKIAGSKHSAGYKHIKIDKKDYLSHRLAFLYMTGAIPEFIDHKDHNRSNNIWSNLRESTHAENMRNISLYKTNKSGFIGVNHRPDFTSRPWVASIRVDGKKKHLGVFVTKEEAIAARKAANIKYEFHENHGS